MAICAARGLTFVARVGEGAFKETFQVRLADGTSQALKVYKPGNSAERAAREIDAMIRCAHPHIGQLAAIDVHQDASGQYLFSLEEFLSGGTLSARLATVGTMAPGEVWALGSALIDALGHIAGLELVHRDLKPDNILFRADGTTPVIVDFGLVRDLAAQSLTQTFLLQGPGTPLFAPAEQLTNEKSLIDWRADQFSLGVLLSYCAFGFHPYAEAADTPVEFVSRVAQHGSPVARFSDAATTAGLPALIKMVAPWPVQRFRTYELLAEAWSAQSSTPASPAPTGSQPQGGN